MLISQVYISTHVVTPSQEKANRFSLISRCPGPSGVFQPWMFFSLAGGSSVGSIAGWYGLNVTSPLVNSSNTLSEEVGLATYNSSMLVETKFDDLHGCMMMCPAGYGCNYSDDGRFYTSASMEAMVWGRNWEFAIWFEFSGHDG